MMRGSEGSIAHAITHNPLLLNISPVISSARSSKIALFLFQFPFFSLLFYPAGTERPLSLVSVFDTTGRRNHLLSCRPRSTATRSESLCVVSRSSRKPWRSSKQ